MGDSPVGENNGVELGLRQVGETDGSGIWRARGPDSGSIGQANKCTGWMPRHEPAKKDVASCEKPRGAASER